MKTHSAPSSQFDLPKTDGQYCVTLCIKGDIRIKLYGDSRNQQFEILVIDGEVYRA